MNNPLDGNESVSENGPNNPAPSNVVAFSLTPATSIGGIIDYSTSMGRKLYSTAISKLEEDLFDCVAEDLYSFLKALKDRAREFGWVDSGVGILSIPDNPVNPTDSSPLLINMAKLSWI